MRNITVSVGRIAQLALVSISLTLSSVAVNSQTAGSVGAGRPGAPAPDLQRLASEARTADLRGNWDGLMRAHESIATMAPSATGGRTWID